MAVGLSLAACDSLQIGDPIAFGAAQTGNLLDQGDFDGGFGNWRACSDPAAITLDANDDNTMGTALLSAGGCIYQTVPAQANDEMVVSCNVSKTGNSWTSVSFGYLDRNYQPLNSVEAPVSSSILSEVSTSLRAPSDAYFAEVLVFTEEGAVVDDCELINISAGLPEEFLVNSRFEQELNGWQSCDTGTATVDNDTVTITEGCITQKFTAYEGVSLTVTCDGVKAGDEHAAVALGYLDIDNQPIETVEAPLSTEAGTFPSVTLTGPATAFFAQVMIYATGEASVNSCSMQMVEADDV